MSVISLQDVSWTYAGAAKPALDRVNLEVARGEAVLVTGPAGAGKSSLCYCLNGIVPNFFPGDFSGRIEVEGHDPSREEIGDLSRLVGTVLEDYGAQLLQPTVIDDIAFALENFGFDSHEITSRVEGAIETVGLKGLEARNPHTLSGGQQQLCAIASVIALVPGVYVLDEPISSLDPLGGEMVSRFLQSLIRKREHTFVIVEQRIEEFIPWVDRIVAMQEGRIVEEGPPFDVLNDEARWERVRAAGVNVPQLFLLAHELRKKVEDGGRLDSLDPAEFPPQFTKALAIAMKGPRPGSAISLDPRSKPTGDPIVRVEHLWHVYEGGTLALRDASLAVHPGARWPGERRHLGFRWAEPGGAQAAGLGGRPFRGSQDHSRRRADDRAGPDDEDRDHGSPADAQRNREDGHPRHPRHGHRREVRSKGRRDGRRKSPPGRAHSGSPPTAGRPEPGPSQTSSRRRPFCLH